MSEKTQSSLKVDTTPDVIIMYSQLTDMLVKIGCRRVLASEQRAFHEPSTNTLLLFPLSPDNTRVPFHQVQMARVNSVQRGVVYEDEFDDHLLAATREQDAAVIA